MALSKVYIVNEPLRWDPIAQQQVKAIDLSPACSFGELVFLLPAGRLPLDPAPTLAALRKGLSNFQPHDYLLLIGNPKAIAWAAILAAEQTKGHLNLLDWQGQQNCYMPVRANVFGDEEEPVG